MFSSAIEYAYMCLRQPNEDLGVDRYLLVLLVCTHVRCMEDRATIRLINERWKNCCTAPEKYI